MITVSDVYNFLNSISPVDTACDFDNVGILVGDRNFKVEKIVVALDCDNSAVDKAIENNAQLIVTHHPVIFEPLRSVTENDIVYRLIKNNISVISMHTNLDVAQNGVTDTLCRVLGLSDIEPFLAHDGFQIRSATTNIESAENLACHIQSVLGGRVRFTESASPISRILVCSGSGGDFLQDAICGGFQALITADVKHNVFVKASDYKIAVFDAGHYETENIIVNPLCERLKNKFESIEVMPHSPNSIKSI